MFFLVSNDGIKWCLDFGPDSVTLTVKDLVQDMASFSQEIPLAVWSLLLSQRQNFLNNHRVRVPDTPNQWRTHEMTDEVLSRVGAQDLDLRGYQVSDLDDAECYWEKNQLDAKAVFRTGIDTPFSATSFGNERFIRKLHSARRTGGQGELSFKNTILREFNTTPCIAEKLFIWNRNTKCSWFCLKKFVPISNTLFVLWYNL